MSLDLATPVLGTYTLGQVLLFVVIVSIMLFLDLHAHKSDEPISVKNASLWSIIWITVGLGFGVYVAKTHGSEDAFSYVSGYLLEKSLSVDNLFVFMAIFTSFAIPDKYQHRILYYGIIGALVMRVIFIALGTSVLEIFGKWAMLVFGFFILWSAWKMFQSARKHASADGTEHDYSNSGIIKAVRKIFPVTNELYGHNFFTRINGKIAATPLFICLLTIEFVDVIFAFDSVPAIIAITQKPFLVYTSNIFAILGLRSMYFLLAAAKKKLQYLEISVILILVFIGAKMLLAALHIAHISPAISLGVILVLLLGGTIGSIIPSKKA